MPQFGAQIDTLRIPIKGLIAEQGTSYPSSPVEGLMCHRTDLKQVFVYLNGAWVQMDNVTGGTASNVTDGDKGMVTVTGGVWNIDPNVITSAMIVDGTVASGDLAAGAAAANLGAAGGDLTGTYPNPTIGTGKVDTTKILDGTIAIGDVNTASVRIDNIGPPQADVSWTNRKITNLGDPTVAQDAATKNYVDSVAAGLDPKLSVKAASTGNLSLTGAATVDGIAIATLDRVLVKDQTTPAQNGIYVGNTAGAWARVTDMDAWAEVPSAFTFVEQGTTQADTGWVCTADQGGTLGTTAIPWVQFTGAAQVISGAGLTKTGNTLDVGAGTGITVAADTVALDTAFTDGRYVQIATAMKKYAGDIGAMTTGNEVTITHNLNTLDVQATFIAKTVVAAGAGAGPSIELTWRAITVNTIGVTTDLPAGYAANAIRVIVEG